MVYKVKYSICCFKTLRYISLIVLVCLLIHLFFFFIFNMVFSYGPPSNEYLLLFMVLMALYKQPARYNFVAPGTTKSNTTFLELKCSRRPA